MSKDFTRTLQTATSAEGVAKLLERAAERAKKAWLLGDAERLAHLAERYRDYAAGLREMAAETETPEPAPDQGALHL